ncbi:hypothetical protein [Planomonospora sphaerica]|nr:hypothetical protein [Planomonospora sphaerica]
MPGNIGTIIAAGNANGMASVPTALRAEPLAKPATQSQTVAAPPAGADVPTQVTPPVELPPQREYPDPVVSESPAPAVVAPAEAVPAKPADHSEAVASPKVLESPRSTASEDPAASGSIEENAPTATAVTGSRRRSTASPKKPAGTSAPRKQRKPVITAQAPAVQSTGMKARQVNAYILPNTYDAALTLATQQGVLYADIAMDAIEWALDQGILEHLVRERTSRTRPAGGRFPGRRIGRSKAEEGTSRVPWPVQFDDAQRVVLKEIMDEVGIRHMSTVIGAAVEAYLSDDEGDERAHEGDY